MGLRGPPATRTTRAAARQAAAIESGTPMRTYLPETSSVSSRSASRALSASSTAP